MTDMTDSKLRIGFSLLRGGGGPTIFMSRLRDELGRRSDVSTTLFFDPTADILLMANKVRNIFKKPYVLRLDGIAFDAALTDNELEARNKDIVDGIRQASGIVFQSEFSKQLVSRFIGIPDVPHVIIPNGIDLSQFNSLGPDKRVSLGIPEDTFVFVTSAKWRSHKRLSATISLFEKFRNEYCENSALIILGDLSTEACKKIDGVHYIGHVQPNDLPQWYRTGDVFLFLSWLDNCPNSVLEAMASGVPVLCTNQGGTKELVLRTGLGIVSEADQEFTFKKVRLYEPPRPDEAKLFDSLIELHQNRHELKRVANYKAISIQSAANSYLQFFRKLVTNEH